MLNEARIKLMTRLATYEAGEGKRNETIGTYFRGDYLGKEIIKSTIYGTVSYVIFVGLYLLYSFEDFLEKLYDYEYILELGKQALYRYLILILLYDAVTYLVYVIRYRRARRSMRIYYNNLQRLNSMVRKENEE